LSKRLTFCRNLIEPLGDEDYFIVHISNDNSFYNMKKNTSKNQLYPLNI